MPNGSVPLLFLRYRLTSAAVGAYVSVLAPAGLRSLAKRVVLDVLPLSVRKRLAVLVGRRRWLNGRYWYSMQLLRDLAREDPAEFHRFLWENHLAYAETYEIEDRFGTDKVHASRRALFEDVVAHLRSVGIEPASDIRSVLDVGCSMGYLLRHMEVEVFPGAEVLRGVDIDAYAIRTGSEHLSGLGSKARIARADMEELEALFAGRTFDVVLCAGVLMYLPEEGAGGVVRTLLEMTDGLAVLTGPAHHVDNRTLEHSVPRTRDGTYVHNIDAMVESAGGRVVFRRWEGERNLDGNTIYFVFAEPESDAHR